MPDPADCKFRAFLSYSHVDTPLAKWLHARLENFPLRDLTGRKTALGPVPKELRPIFRDREDFSAGLTLTPQTIAALDASAALILLCSPASAKSHAVNEEVRLFKQRCPDRLIVPVILAGKPNNGVRECFPPALKFKLDAGGKVTDQPADVPIAPDVPEEGRELVLSKVVASLIGVPPDQVFKRAERERRRWTRIRYGVAAIVLLLVCGAGYFALRSSRQAAEIVDVGAVCAKYLPAGSAAASSPGAKERCEQAISAIAEGTATDPRYKEALDLIKAGKAKEAEPLLRESAEEEEAAGLKRLKQAAEKWRNLGAIAGYADPQRAREYYAKAAKLDPDDINGLMWHAQMEQDAGNLAEAERAYSAVSKLGVKGRDDHELLWASLGLGDIRAARGELAGALKAYHEAEADGERLTKTAPNDAGWQRDLSVAYDKVGDVLVAQGNLADALNAYRDSLRIRERLAQADPGNAGWQRDLSVSHNKVGDVLVAQGNLADALNAYRDGLAIAERLARADPGNAGWQYDLGISNERIGDVQMAQGDLAAALKSYEAKRDIISRLAKADPGNAGWQRDLSISYNKVGDVLVAQGNLADALNAYRDSLRIRERLAQADPGNAGWQRDLSVSHNKVGDVLVAQGNLADALNAYRDGLAIFERLAKADPGNAGWQRDLSVAYNKVGDVLVAQGNLADALKGYRDGLAIAERLAKADPGNAGWQRDLSVSYEKVGDVLVAQGNLADALNAYRDGLAIRERLAKADPGNAGWQRDLSVSYEKVGDVLVAQGNLADALNAYRDGLAIRERLAKANSGNAGWQRDLAVSNERLGGMLARDGKTAEAVAAFERALGIYEILIARVSDPQARVNSVVPLWRLGALKGKGGKQELRRALAILVELRDANRLDADRIKWIPKIEAQIAALDK